MFSLAEILVAGVDRASALPERLPVMPSHVFRSVIYFFAFSLMVAHSSVDYRTNVKNIESPFDIDNTRANVAKRKISKKKFIPCRESWQP